MFVLLILLAVVGWGLFNPSPAVACDLCAVYNSIETQRGQAHSITAGLAYQLTYNETNFLSPIPPGSDAESLRDEQQTQFLSSNIIQLYANYQIDPRFAVQVNVPFITRQYRRVEDGSYARGDETGFGDTTVLLKATPYRDYSRDWSINTQVFGGVKLPTGSADRLSEELDEVISLIRGESTNPGNLVGGDDLALGTGSYDLLFGTGVLLQYLRFYLSANVQYIKRTEGSFDYKFGDDIQWNVGPAVYLILEDERTLALRARFSGEEKDNDEILGVRIGNSDETNIFAGPEIVYTYGRTTHIRLSGELPLQHERSSDGVVPRFRVIASASYNF